MADTFAPSATMVSASRAIVEWHIDAGAGDVEVTCLQGVIAAALPPGPLKTILGDRKLRHAYLDGYIQVSPIACGGAGYELTGLPIRVTVALEEMQVEVTRDAADAKTGAIEIRHISQP